MPVLPVAARAARALGKRARARGPGQRSARRRARLLDELADYGQARGWAPETLRRARNAVTAVLASGEDLGQPPWDAAGFGGS